MNSPKLQWLGLLGSLLLATLLYWPGLSGGYLFDDFPNIVDNNAVHVTSFSWHDWRLAALASPSAELRRPLAMLSFAANHFFTGLDSRPMKLTNLFIHLLNGLLLWAMLSTLLKLWQERRPGIVSDEALQWTALGLTTAWLVSPINLTPVLYVVQRMESLAQTFVVAGLWLYLRERRRMLAGEQRTLRCAASLALGSLLGLLCKESALLLPLYAFLVEVTLLRFDAPTAMARRKLWTVFAALLLAPAAIGLAWLLPHSLDGYAYRPFTLEQRLWTEGRVLLDYAAWTLLPVPGNLTFYHDDIAVSQGWLSPPATLFSALLIAASLGAAIALRRRIPLLSLGILWYFAAHLMTATIIPLELVFEHRNYFASIGLLLAAGALLLEIPARFRLIRGALPIVALAMFSAVLAMRSNEWGNPIRFAYAEALEHPESPRANYELGRTLTVASGYRTDSKLTDPAMQAFERAAALPDSDTAAPAGLIIVANHMHREVKPEWWQNLTRRLSRQPPSQEDIGALQSLVDCQRKGECAPETIELLSAFLAALNHPAPNDRLLAAYGAFAANLLGDYPLAASMFRDALTISPDSTGYRIDLASVLVLEGKRAEALEVVKRLDPANLDHAEIRQIDDLKRQLGPIPETAGKP